VPALVAAEQAIRSETSSSEARIELLTQARSKLSRLHDAAVRVAGITASGSADVVPRAVMAFEDLPRLQILMSGLQSAGDDLARHGLATLSPSDRIVRQFELAAEHARAAELIPIIEARLAGLPASADPPAARAPFAKVGAALSDVRSSWLVATPEPVSVATQDRLAAARQEVQDLRAAMAQDVESRLRSVLDKEQRRGSWLLAMLVISVSLSMYLTYAFYLVIRGGLDTLNQQIKRMAAGDLSGRSEPLGSDEVADTMSALTSSLTRMSDLLAAVRQGSASSTHAAEQVARGNADLRKRNQLSNDSVDEVVQGVQRFTAQLESCAHQVSTVVQVVQALRLEAERNRKQMLRLRERMTSLRGKSREIAEAVTLIDGVAFRTNVLALNASIEASKAGEVGRGFAVVAQEVRSLAQRSAESARRIGAIVGRSTDDIEQSGALVDETGMALARADEHVDKIHIAMRDVSELTRSGEADSILVLSAITKLQEEGKQSTVLVEQLAQAATALRSQGEHLTHKLDQFKLA